MITHPVQKNDHGEIKPVLATLKGDKNGKTLRQLEM